MLIIENLAEYNKQKGNNVGPIVTTTSAVIEAYCKDKGLEVRDHETPEQAPLIVLDINNGKFGFPQKKSKEGTGEAFGSFDAL